MTSFWTLAEEKNEIRPCKYDEEKVEIVKLRLADCITLGQQLLSKLTKGYLGTASSMMKASGN
jgi:hypothetical protein